MSTRNALTKALEQQGFIAKGKFDTSSKLWIDSEKENLSEIMQRYGIEWKKLGTHNNHLSVLGFKKQERKKEIICLENKIECTDNILKNRRELLGDTERIIDELDGKYQKKKENISHCNFKGCLCCYKPRHKVTFGNRYIKFSLHNITSLFCCGYFINFTVLAFIKCAVLYAGGIYDADYIGIESNTRYAQS